MSTTSQTLIQQLKCRDPNAWREFVALYTPMIFVWARQKGLKTTDAEDVCQEVLIAMHGILVDSFEYDRSKSFRALLKTVAVRKAINWAKQNRREVPLLDAHDSEETPDFFEEFEFRRQLIRQALVRLEKTYDSRSIEAFSLRFGGESTATVAQKLNMKKSQVAGATSRIKSALRQMLSGMLDQGGF